MAPQEIDKFIAAIHALPQPVHALVSHVAALPQPIHDLVSPIAARLDDIHQQVAAVASILDPTLDKVSQTGIGAIAVVLLCHSRCRGHGQKCGRGDESKSR
jgi:hypothetical protein